jgi:hypothetical protein
MRSVLRQQPAVLVSLLFSTVIFTMYLAAARHTGGMFVYPLDDSYIHLALARTLVLHHNWGINPTEFASASSSPGWTVLLAMTDAVGGLHLVNGIILNAICAIALLFAVDHSIKIFVPSVRLWFRYLTLVAILFCTPLTSLTMIGMEHVAQALSVLLFVIVATQILSLPLEAPTPPATAAWLFLIALFAGAIRYEAVFVVVPVCICLVLRRRVGVAVLAGLGSAVAPVIFGIYFHHKSGFWLPFSVMAKASGQPPLSVKYFLDQTHGFRSLLPLIALGWLLRFRKFGFWHSSQLLLFFAGSVTLLHLAVAPVGWLMRYESYLVCLCLFALCVVAAGLHSPGVVVENIRQSSASRKYATALLGLLVLGLGFDLTRRATQGIVEPIHASEDRFLEHIQMAKIVSGAYDHDAVVVNDIGTIAFYSDAHLLDVIGLGSVEPIRDRMERHSFTAADVASWASAQNASIAILQTQWQRVSSVIPPTWMKIQTWTIPRNVVFKDFEISFFAIEPKEIPRLCAILAKFPPPRQDKITFRSPACTATP